MFQTSVAYYLQTDATAIALFYFGDVSSTIPNADFSC